MEIHRSVRRLLRQRVYCTCSEWSWSKYEILCYQWGSTPIVENAIAEKAMAYDWAWKRGQGEDRRHVDASQSDPGSQS